MIRIAILLVLASLARPLCAEDWPAALSAMPLPSGTTELTRTNCAEIVLGAFQPEATVKALIFMPGATDELYFFRRVHAHLTNASPTLSDAVLALTNQSPLRATFRAPFLLIHSTEDVLDLDCTIAHGATAARLKSVSVPGRLIFLDRDWNAVRAALRDKVRVSLAPGTRSSMTRHFYRHTFAAWDLTAWETLQATALAGKTRFSVQRRRVAFGLDERFNSMPKLERFPD
jgi:hypothetical protein